MSALLSLLSPDSVLWGLVAAAVAALFYVVRKGGKDSAKTEQLQAEKKARDIADQVENDIGTIPPDKRREELKRWGSKP